MHRLVLKDPSVGVRNDHETSTIIIIIYVKQQHHNDMTKTIATHNKSITKKQLTIRFKRRQAGQRQQQETTTKITPRKNMTVTKEIILI
jgi:hypothetical protein